MTSPLSTLTRSGVALALTLAFGSTATQGADFEKEILPIFKEHCFDCHQAPFYDDTGRLKKPKSGLRMDNAELLIEGGDGTDENGDDGGVALTPGDSAESTIYTMMGLHEDEDMAMPPKGDRVPKDQQELVKAWIDAGADFGGWEGAPKDAEPTPPAE